MLVVGDRDVEAATVAVRRHGEGDRGTMPLEEALGALRAELQ